RAVLLPLWNAYSFFVTYANLAHFEPQPAPSSSDHPLDRWIRAEVQDLVNRMTAELDRYNLSATCGEIHATIDALTHWYIRLSRRRFAGKDIDDCGDLPSDHPVQHQALATLYDILLTFVRLLAPFCPFITEAIERNLVPEEHNSVHLTDWPNTRVLSLEEHALLQKTRTLRRIVSLGLRARSEAGIKLRQLSDPGALGERIALVDARKAGPRLGARVQEVINAGKRGEFEERDDGAVRILDELLTPEEVRIVYQGSNGEQVQGEGGIVVRVDTQMTDALRQKGLARDLIRAVQRLRKETGLRLTERIVLQIEGNRETLKNYGDLIARETRATLGHSDSPPHVLDIDGQIFSVRFTPHSPSP
ncbi:class I tRNA ligase family protein, partial [Candidatus Peregrinibacteria bacterium]|nr:class I tRNA ligase family protein [Candidatus Peregrinibacteria bacterium]